MNRTDSMVDEVAANDLVRASALYRKGEYDLAIILIDKSVMRALTILLEKHGVKIGKERYLYAHQLMHLAFNQGLITNEDLLHSVVFLHDLKNRLTHGREMKVDADLVRMYLDIGYELLGTVPYKEEESKKFKQFEQKETKDDVMRFGNNAKKYTKKKFGNTHKIKFEPLIGKSGKIYRPDAYMIDKKQRITLIEFKHRILNKKALVRNMLNLMMEIKYINPNVYNMLVLMPKSEKRKIGITTEHLLKKEKIEFQYV